ncbi:hypothetical protein JW851_01380 [Candidatus Woesearchaeota archaeon]|nr:hypothetical protein [Candidatus Woesearchaeota archaeon]
MSRYIAKKGFIYYLKHKKWKKIEFLEPLLIVPLAYLALLIVEQGLTPWNILYCLAGLAYITVLCRFYKIK